MNGKYYTVTCVTHKVISTVLLSLFLQLQPYLSGVSSAFHLSQNNNNTGGTVGVGVNSPYKILYANGVSTSSLYEFSVELNTN